MSLLHPIELAMFWKAWRRCPALEMCVVPDCTIHVFRSSELKPGSPVTIAVALRAVVEAVYGDHGGAFGAGAIVRAFGGAAVFHSEQDGTIYAGGWGARNVSRFRADLGKHFALTVADDQPPARLVFWCVTGKRPRGGPAYTKDR